MSNTELIQDYIDYYQHSKQSQKTRKSALNYFFVKYGYKGNILDLSTKDLRSYFTWLKNLEGINLTTKRNKWNLLTSFINWLMEDEENNFLLKIPSKRVNWNGTSNKTNRSNKKVYATKEQLIKILDYFQERNITRWLIFKIFTHTGMRKGELINLRIDEINIEDRHIHLYIGKTSEKHYFLPKNDFFLTMLKSYYKSRKSLNTLKDHFFLNSRFDPFNIRTFNKWLLAAREKINITDRITCHTFRRTLNDYRKVMNCPLEDREVLLGHKTQNVNINGYTQTDISRLRRLYDKWNPYNF